MENLYEVLGKALIEMRKACREASRSGRHHDRWEEKKAMFLKALEDIEGQK